MGEAMLRGIRVLELGQVIAGTYAGIILADMGAEVVKIELLHGATAQPRHRAAARRECDPPVHEPRQAQRRARPEASGRPRPKVSEPAGRFVERLGARRGVALWLAVSTALVFVGSVLMRSPVRSGEASK